MIELGGAVGFSVCAPALLDFEHKVMPQRGIGKASYTDLMISSDSILIAVESKWTEPRYEDVNTWLGDPAKPNRREVLTGWLGLLQSRGGCACRIPDVASLPYQMIHRAASACTGNANRRFLVYQVFGNTAAKRDEYLADLMALNALLDTGSPLSIYLAICAIHQEPRQAELEALWDSGRRDLAESVVAGLRSGGLLEVELEEVITV